MTGHFPVSLLLKMPFSEIKTHWFDSQDHNHSHFILTDSGAPPASENLEYFKEFGKEIQLRANLESSVSSKFPLFRINQLNIRPFESGWPARQMEQHIINAMRELEIGWHDVIVRNPES